MCWEHFQGSLLTTKPGITPRNSWMWATPPSQSPYPYLFFLSLHLFASSGIYSVPTVFQARYQIWGDNSWLLSLGKALDTSPHRWGLLSKSTCPEHCAKKESRDFDLYLSHKPAPSLHRVDRGRPLLSNSLVLRDGANHLTSEFPHL